MGLRSSIIGAKEPKPSRTKSSRAAARLGVVPAKPFSAVQNPIVTRAIEVFGDLSHAQLWLSKPNERFGNLAPAEILGTETGRHQVEEMLGQIDEGMFA